MQLVGKSCGVCNNKIAAQLNVKYCIDCEKVYHDVCLSGDVRCPSCNKSIESDLRHIDEVANLEYHNNARKAVANKHAIHMTIGLLVAVGGCVVTYTTHRAASENGGSYIIAYGAIAFGAADFLVGLFGWIANRT